jgi:hypothetical protein
VYHVLLVALVLTIALGFWNIVHYAPRALSRILPHGVMFPTGAVFFAIAIFSAYIGSWELRDPDTMIGSFVQGFVGIWFMLAGTADSRGSPEDQVFMRRAFGMVLVLMGVIIASLYISSYQLMAAVNLTLVCVAFIAARRYFRTLH